ncbi:phosphotransferase enzyme family protein [Flaviflagellibacter deserti]|uniref:Phosphotransferase enzyme family protein n=1 Tax=Flaviflagellibacter deserti TaxID=2267266 RepID=A0ABV9Z1Z3_9HYPH
MLYEDAFLQRLETGLRSALPNWRLPSSAPLSLLTISENATYVAEDEANGRRVILRVHRPDYHTRDEIVSELNWISALREDGVVETPRPIPAKDGELLCAFDDSGHRRYVVAFEHMSGKEPDTSDDLVKWYGVLGAINARLHTHSRGWAKPTGFARKNWNFDTIIGSRAHWGDWRDGLGLDAGGRAILERAAALLERQTAAYGSSDDKYGLVHCDMRPANLLVDGDRLGVIDFDDCGTSWFAYDFAASVSFLESEPFIPELMSAWVDGYRDYVPLSREDEATLPMFLMLRRLQLTAWIASHSETPTAQSMGVPYTEGSVALAESYLTKNG